MKKILVSIFAVFYLASSVGATVHLHYCMDKIIGWSLLNSTGDKCNKCGMEKDGGCCKDENKFVKNNIDQKVAEPAVQLIQMAAVAAPNAFIYSSEHYFSSSIQEYPISNAPPRSNGVGIYILNSVFRI
ncbi:MAG TPA: hypothetical protein VHQ93_11870 [Chitinophagaceae bacterium]|jgi:hypothetical protein|nr:hypothetical protein [Chitinophagaceae bacterium]